MRKLLFILLTVSNLLRAEEPKRFNGYFSTAVNSDFRQLNDVDKDLSISSAVKFSYLFPEIFTVSSGIFYDKDLVGMRKGKIKDTFISFSRRLGEINQYFPISGQATVFLPISESSRERSFLNTGYKLTGIVGVKVPSIPAISGSFNLNYTQNFHNSAVAMNGQSNKQFLFSAGGMVGYAFLNDFEASINFDYVKGITYHGKIVDTYGIGQEISYNASKKINIGVGHSLGGNIFKVNGYDSNISLFDLNESTVYLVFTMEIL